MTSATDNEYYEGAMETDDAHGGGGASESNPRPKRMACILCRKRKLKCDGHKPSCGTCARLSHDCEYSEERKKSGPKRGYVKLLEARLKQVENLLESRETPREAGPSTAQTSTAPETYVSGPSIPPIDIPAFGDASMPDLIPDDNYTDPPLGGINNLTLNAGDDFTWEMIGLGLEEALPAREVMDELNEIYFEKVHPSLPMIHKARFLASMDLAPLARPAPSLRYAMWTNVCAMTPKYSVYAEHFYKRAHKYAQMDEMRGHGESMITIAHCQAWTLLASYEFKHMYFPRAWMSVGKAARLAQMMGLHRQDRVGLDVKQTLPPPRDWTDREERRRTFWAAYCQDRYASVGTGWPMVIDEQDILTNLPASDKAFNSGQPEPTPQLSDILNGEGASSLSPFGGIILLATLYGRNLTHLHRPDQQDKDYDLNGAFWKRHRFLDNILLNTSLSLPSHLRLPAGLNDPNTVFLNMNIHTATICLHQAAIFKADHNRLPAQISAESKRRCIVAADQITNIMKMISHIDLSMMNPFLAFCLYVAARVFVQYLKARREDAAVKSSLHFLLSAMNILKAKNPLTESFLVQLDVDLEGSGLDVPNSGSRWKFGHRPPGEVPANTDGVKCTPIFEIRQTQNASDTQGSTAWPGDKSINPSPFNGTYPSLYASSESGKSNRNGQAGLVPMGDGFDVIYDFPVQSVGTDTSPENSHQDSSGSRPHSNQPTPSSSSQHNSSRTSHTSPPNQSFGVSGANDAQQQQSPGFGLATTDTWGAMNAPNQSNEGVMGEVQDLDFGPTGMTPVPDSMWPTGGVGEANDWMYNWPGSTPQPQ
ncbi:hypothetical protein A1O1_08152 [Capronia coronata CBS 617.96]|uniref:Zn(2)-C6 fungal-type domain-containing protein n=1 Tax=Capronia coronata CBS 617.96 TaxID=1182541 RepID=W9XPD6_9EURO|nr:uncharacterized protein A1O1_08152 [Capronia coronata CBS 617.96]EXJ82083.1 hypothetical protein A1O1_08152 [Capronia coronata CBS 617.96]